MFIVNSYYLPSDSFYIINMYFLYKYLNVKTCYYVSGHVQNMILVNNVSTLTLCCQDKYDS